MIRPINNHILIEPLKHDRFMASDKGTFEEVGIVIYVPDIIRQEDVLKEGIIKVGDKVYFDGWLASKYPKNETEFFWLVKFEDIRAIDNGK